MEAAQSDALVFFGASGDLAFKQIFPALLGLVADEGVHVPIVGVAKAGWTVDQLRARAKDSIEQHGGADPARLAKLLGLLRYVDGDYNDPQTFAQLKEALGGAKRPLHYLAIPPSLFGVVVSALAKSGLNADARVVVEKPFGRDRESAQALNRTLLADFPEEAIFRIDHYLGKEPVQNILYTRFANATFEPSWNRNYVRCIQITMAESFGVQDRGSFYDAVGALRDVVQNHMLQVLANVMMDAPTGEEHEAARPEGPASEGGPAARRRERRARAISRLSGGQGSQTGFDGRNLYRGEAVRGQLAMGRGSHLYPRRQMPAPDRRRGHGRIQAAAPLDVRRADRPVGGLSARAAEPGRRRRAWLADEASRRADDRRQCRTHADGAGWVGDAAVSAPARRCNARGERAVRARRHRRRAVAHRGVNR